LSASNARHLRRRASAVRCMPLFGLFVFLPVQILGSSLV
jgi:hypothetical protein